MSSMLKVARNNFFCVPENISHNLACRWLHLEVLMACRSYVLLLHWRPFAFWYIMWIHVLSQVIMRLRNSFCSSQYCVTRDWQASIRCCLCSSVGCFGVHLGDTWKNLRCSWITVSTDLKLRLNFSAISQTITRLSAIMHASACLMLWSIIAVRGASTQMSSSVDWRRLWAWANHSNTVECDNISLLNSTDTVSYTHLTLPTNREV